jgi:Methyltransferase domain
MEHFYQNIMGWFDYAHIYDRMIESAPYTAHFVEIGTYHGQSAAYMAVEIINSNKQIRFDTIDCFIEGPLIPINAIQVDYAWNNNKRMRDVCLRNLEPVLDKLNLIDMSSPAASVLYDDESLDFVWIDGNHHNGGPTRDVEAWWPKLKLGGYMGGHDFTMDQIRNAVNNVVLTKYKNPVTLHPGWWTISWLTQKQLRSP